MKWSGLIILWLFISGISLPRCGGDSSTIDTVACPIGAALDKIKVAENYYNKKVQLKTRLYYGASEYKRAWLEKRGPDKMYEALIQEIKESNRYGLVPEEYHLKQLEAAVTALYDNRKRTNADISNLDIQITASFFLFTTHLLEGRVRHPGAQEYYWQRGMPLENDIALLLKMVSASDLRKEIKNLHPRDPQYNELQEALKEYRALQERDTLPALTSPVSIKPGDSVKAVRALRKKLQLLDYRISESDNPAHYDEGLVNGVKEFQARHGLEANGVVDAATARSLNIPLSQKVALITLNLERLRWRTHLTGEADEIVINVPEYMLRVYRNKKVQMQMRVVLGSEFTPTPVFHDTLKYIVFSPTWIVPKSIFEKEFYPKLREDATHFSSERFIFFRNGKEIDPQEEDWNEKNLDVSSYSVVEKPGDVNSLGKVKFIMPNHFSVYLHDTPAGRLFRRGDRALSHGCIRLEKPAAFAAYLLEGNKGWNAKKIRVAMDAGEPLRVDLNKPYPVFIVYRTVWVDDAGRVQFREDIYGHDKRQLAALN